MSFDSEGENDYELCCGCRGNCDSNGLPFEPGSIERIILTLSDNFNLRVVLSDERTKGALMLTTGLALAGTIIGKRYGGKLGAAVGGAVGGACGIGIVAVSMREVWNDIKPKLAGLFDLVYDYLAGLGIDDYAKAMLFLTKNSASASQLTMIIVQTASQILGRQVLSNLVSA